MKQALTYSLKVWLTIVLFFPIANIALDHTYGWTIERYLSDYWDCVPGELIVSFVPIVLFIWYTAWANGKHWTYKTKKGVILILTELVVLIQCGLYLWYHIASNGVTVHMYLCLIAYALIAAIAILFFELKPTDNAIAMPPTE